MATQVQWRGGSTAEHATFTGAAREITVDTQKQTVVLHDGSTAGGRPLLREDGSNSALALGSAATPALKFTGDPNTGIYSPGADQVAISTGGTGRLFVDASGNVGVGATATANGVLRLNVPTGYNANLVFSVDGTDRYILGQVADVAALRIYDLVAASERLRITSDGKVGIGTSSPDALLTVNGVGAFGAGSAAAPSIAITGDLNTGIYSPGADQVAISTNGTGRLFVDANGNVGINEPSPSFPLVIRSTGTCVQQFKRATTVLGYIGEADQIITSGLTTDLAVKADGNLVFGAGSLSERMRLDSSGRLLVGTSTTTSLAGLAGLAQVEGATASTAGISAWCNNDTATTGSYLALGRARGSTIGSNTAVQNNDDLGRIYFFGANGTDRNNWAAEILCSVDGTPFSAGDTTDLPGRLVFSTTADGASSPTERMRIKNNGTINFSNVATYADNAAATAGGLAVGDVYRTATGQLMIRY